MCIVQALDFFHARSATQFVQLSNFFLLRSSPPC